MRPWRYAVTFALALAVPVLTLPAAGRALVASEGEVPADATLLTYSVNSFARPEVRQEALAAASQRYGAGRGPVVLLSVYRSGDPAFDDLSPQRTTWAVGNLTKAGVPAQAIETLPAVSGEYEEAGSLRAAARDRGWRRVVAYTTEIRSRRTQSVLKRAGESIGVDVQVVALRDPDVPLDHWWRSRSAAIAVANEYPRLLYYFLLGRL